MHPEDKKKLVGAMFLGAPFIGWLTAAKLTMHPGDGGPKWILEQVAETAHSPVLLGGIVGGFASAIALTIALNYAGKSVFQGAKFNKHLRGTRLVTASELSFETRKGKGEKVNVAGVPMPLKAEPTHLLIAGSTGTGKSVLLRSLAFSAALRSDRLFICDPNGDLYQKFGRPGDHILNPYDPRGEGWSIFNEIRKPYDYERYAESLIQSSSPEEEEWCGYARLLWRETARQVVAREGLSPGQTLMGETYRWVSLETPENLQAFLVGTHAQALFTGADKALASARFILAKSIPQHLKVPQGDFSIRDWLADPDAGNLFLTWREDQAAALRPLISSWVDVFCTSILSLDENPKRRIWAIFDELGSLNKLPSLEAAATKGRKAGLRLVAGLQSVSQLDEVYGPVQAQTLRSCFRSLVVLGGAQADNNTAEEMSKAIGDHEVERYAYSSNTGDRSSGHSHQIKHDRERAVLPSEITDLPELTGYLAFAGNYPVARFTLEIANFANVNAAFVETETA